MLDAIRSQRSFLRSRGLYLGVLPALCLVLALLAGDRGGEGRGAGEAWSAAGPVAGWVGLHESELGLRVHVRLAPLHARPARQAFESRALARRLDLGPGEPWRLVLRLVSASRGGEARGHLRLGALTLEDEGGPALATIERAAQARPGEVADPLATLLAPPEGVRAGEEVGLVLWGRPPRAGLRLRGLALAEREGGEERSIELALEQRALDPGAAEEALASTTDLERGAAAERGERAARRRR